MADLQKTAFTLVEILIVAAILSILAAVVIPAFENYATKAKESAARENLSILRTAVERYAAQHNDVAPGYQNGDTETSPNIHTFWLQLVTMATNEQGVCRPQGTPGFPLGPYLSALPKNPFNNLATIIFISNADEVPAEATGEFGWIYKAATKTIRIDYPGTDSAGIRYYDY